MHRQLPALKTVIQLKKKKVHVTKYDDNLDGKDIENCVKKYLNSPEKKFQICKYDFKYITEELIGYLGAYQRGSITYEVDGQEEVLHLFIKSMPLHEKQAEIVKTYGFFERETSVYSQIFPKFTERKGDDKFFPNCFYINDNKLFCEDLSIMGYKNKHRRECFDDDHVFVALSQIAKFHAESIILEESVSNGFIMENEFKNFLNPIGYAKEGWFEAGMNAGLAAAKTSPNFPDNPYAELFEKKWNEFFDAALELCKASEKYRNVLCHRDLWCNNLMFRSDEHGKPIQAMIIDFQICGCMPPAGDVMGFIYLNVIDERRHTNLEFYLRHYYNVLCEEIRKRNFDAEDVFPWNTFRESCEEYKLMALMQCLTLHQLGLIEGKYSNLIFGNDQEYERIMKVSRDDLILQMMQKDSEYREKIMFSIEEIIKLCL